MPLSAVLNSNALEIETPNTDPGFVLCRVSTFAILCDAARGVKCFVTAGTRATRGLGGRPA